ncbi:hypothetical protein ABFS83_05G093000 [Erythranthe nasuta]
MAASSSSCFSLLLVKSQNFKQHKNGGDSSLFLRNNTNLRRLLHTATTKTGSNRSHKDLIVRNAAPEAAATVDLLSSFSLPSIPGISDSPLIALIAGLTVGLPFVIQRLLTLTKEIDMAAETVEKIADAVGKVAEEVDKAAEGIAESLPEGGLKKMVHVIEDLAEETAKDAQKVEDLMDKVEELDDKLEAFLEKQSKGPGKA